FRGGAIGKCPAVWQPPKSDKPLIQYLLGELSSPERDAIEDRYLTDEAFHEELLVCEGELIDAYVRGELSFEQRGHFERWFLRSPGRQEQLKFAKALVRFGSESPMPAGSSPPLVRAEFSQPEAEPSALSLWMWLKTRRLGLQVAFALFLIVVMLLPWAFRVSR